MGATDQLRLSFPPACRPRVVHQLLASSEFVIAYIVRIEAWYAVRTNFGSSSTCHCLFALPQATTEDRATIGKAHSCTLRGWPWDQIACSGDHNGSLGICLQVNRAPQLSSVHLERANFRCSAELATSEVCLEGLRPAFCSGLQC